MTYCWTLRELNRKTSRFVYIHIKQKTSDAHMYCIYYFDGISDFYFMTFLAN